MVSVRNVFLLAAANLRSHKRAGISLGIIVLIAAMLLNLGLLGVITDASLIRGKISELHTQSMAVIVSDEIGAARQAKIESLVAGSFGVTATQTERLFYFASAVFPYKGSGSYSNTILFEDVNSAGNMGRFKLIGSDTTVDNDSIYVPYIVKTKGYEIGDTLAISYLGKTYSFKIAGFTEDILFGAISSGGLRFFLPHQAFQKFARQLDDSSVSAVMYSAQTGTDDQAASIYDAINKQIANNPMDVTLICGYSIDIVKLADSMPVSIGAAMEISFAFIVALVALLVMRFRIVNSIGQDMRNIGALQAVGYTSRLVRGGYVLQFLLIALTGAAAGIGLSYAIAVPHNRMLAAETGMNWSEPFSMTVALVTIAVILACVALVALLATKRIRRLPVIVALRGGITTHSFRKNHLPLESAHGPLNLLLSMKSTVANLRQNVALMLILAAVSFASVFIFMMYYNFNVNDTVMMHTFGGETNDILIGAASVADEQTLLKELPQLENVAQVIDFGYGTIDVDGKTGWCRITPDFSKLKNNQVYEGRYPKHDNEVAIGGQLAARLHKGVGDTVALSCGNISRNYLITGLTQSLSTLGKGVFLTDAGMRRSAPDYQPVTVYVYVSKGANVQDVMDAIRTRYASKVSLISNEYAATKSALSTYESVVAAFSALVFAVMGVIVILILALITGTTLVRRRQEFGIEKALGFTTGQLVRQIAVSFLPLAVVGSLAGGVAGFYGANPLMSCLFRAMGIMKVNFYLPPLSVLVISVAIALLTLLISALAAANVRKISPCVLVTE